MKKAILLSAASLVLTSCIGPGELFESRTYGIRNSEWVSLSTAERYAARQTYLQEEALEEQRRMNNLLYQQHAQILRDHNNNHYAQSSHREASIDHRHLESARQNQIATEQQSLHDNIHPQNTLHQTPRVSQEQRAIEEAKRRSLLSYQQEQTRRRQLREQEQRELNEAMQRSMETYNAEQIARQANQSPAVTNDNWQPNEGQIVRAGELVMNLQRELGRQPSASEMQHKLQGSMGLSTLQSNKILDDLGLI